MNSVLTDRRRPVDDIEEKSASVTVIVERINVALCANDKLVTSLSMAGSLYCIFHSFVLAHRVWVYPCYISTFVFVAFFAS